MTKPRIKILLVKDRIEGFDVAKKVLYKNVDDRTALFLSGGSTPKFLYQNLAKEKKLIAGTAALVDERYFQNSELKFTNEDMIRNTGLISYLDSNDISFCGILENKSLKETASGYDKVVQNLFEKFPKIVAILGIGKDGHTAGLSPRNEKLKIKNEKFAEYFEDFPGELKERISLTFHAIYKMDMILVLVFGKEKKKALELLFSEGSIAEIPARFLNQPEISKRTLLITDQKL